MSQNNVDVSKLIKFHITFPHIVFPLRTDQWLNIAVHQDVQHTCQVCHQNVQWRADTITDHLHTHQLSPSQYWAANMPGYRSLYCIYV